MLTTRSLAEPKGRDHTEDGGGAESQGVPSIKGYGTEGADACQAATTAPAHIGTQENALTYCEWVVYGGGEGERYAGEEGVAVGGRRELLHETREEAVEAWHILFEGQQAVLHSV